MNGYDQSFLEWFKKHGWRIRQGISQVDIWTNGDAHCPFKVDEGMISRLEAAGEIERFFPEQVCAWEDFWVLKEKT